VRRPLTIALLSFDRPDYLRKVVRSLVAQLIPGDEVLLFQDGGWNGFSGIRKASEDVIDACVGVFSSTCGDLQSVEHGVFRSPLNLGIAGNYRRAEQYVFEVLDRDAAVLLEDDLVLGPHYLGAIADLLGIAAEEPRIGYVSAYGDFWAPLSVQRKLADQLTPMHENWGAALTRTSWLAQRPVRELYWELVKDADYSQRDHEAILGLYEGMGYRCNVSSQDASRWVACRAAGMVRLMTATCHARYIGVVGEHAREDLYQRWRFGEAKLFPERPIVREPTDDQFDAWLGADAAAFADGYVHSYQKPGAVADLSRGRSDDAQPPDATWLDPAQGDMVDFGHAIGGAPMAESAILFVADDGVRLSGRRWLPEGPPRGVVQISHGLAEHSARYARLAAALNAAGYGVYANDHRGHGPKAAPADLGHFADEGGWGKVVGDLWTMNRLIAKEQPSVPIVFLGHSLGSFLGQDFVAEHSDALAGAVFSGSSGKPAAIATLGRLIARAERLRLGKRGKSALIGKMWFGAFNKPFEPARTAFDWLSRDEKEVDLYVADPYCGFPTSTQLAIDVLDALPGLLAPGRLARIRKDLPIYVFSGERDPVGANLQGLIDDLKDAGFTRLTTRIYPDARHETLNELNREEVTRDLIAWLDGIASV